MTIAGESEASRRSRAQFRSMGFWFFGLVALALLAFGTCTAYWELTATRVSDVESLIEKNLPRGSTTEEIVAFLDSREIPSGEIKPFDPNVHCCELQDAGVATGTLTLSAFMEDTRHDLACAFSIHIEFILDARGRLTDHVVWETSACL